jgi:preprotein translocase subunit SecG
MIPMLAQLPPIAINLMVVGFLIVCLIMILTVLIQKPQGGGLSGAFGSGAGSGQTAFGARTGDALTVATIAIFVIYLLAAIGLNYTVRPTIAAPSEVQATTTEQTPPAVPGAPTAAPTTETAPVAPVPVPPAATEPAAEPASEPTDTPAAEPAAEPADPQTPPSETPPTETPANPG